MMCFATENKQNPPRKEPVANKKQILLSLVDGSGDARGHRFATTRDTSNNLQIKCEDCGLWIQQIDSKSVFNRKAARITPSALRRRIGAGTHHTTCVTKGLGGSVPGAKGFKLWGVLPLPLLNVFVLMACLRPHVSVPP